MMRHGTIDCKHTNIDTLSLSSAGNALVVFVCVSVCNKQQSRNVDKIFFYFITKMLCYEDGHE